MSYEEYIKTSHPLTDSQEPRETLFTLKCLIHTFVQAPIIRMPFWNIKELMKNEYSTYIVSKYSGLYKGVTVLSPALRILFMILKQLD